MSNEGLDAIIRLFRQIKSVSTIDYSLEKELTVKALAFRNATERRITLAS